MKRVFASMFLGLVVVAFPLVSLGGPVNEPDPPFFLYEDFDEPAPGFPLGRLLFVAVTVGCVVWALYPKADFSIRLRHGRVRFHGAVPQAQTSEIAQFLRSEFGENRSLRVSGRRLKHNRLTFGFGGRLSPQERQRI